MAQPVVGYTIIEVNLETLVKLENLCMEFVDKGGVKNKAVDDVSFEIFNG